MNKIKPISEKHKRFRTTAEGEVERDYSREAGDRDTRRILERRFIKGLVAGSIMSGMLVSCAVDDDKPENEPIEKPVVAEEVKQKRGKTLRFKYGEQVVRCTLADKRYSVELGDNLWAIAEEHNGGIKVSSAWIGTMEINTDALVEPGNYDLIMPDQRLKVLAECEVRAKPE